LVPEDKFEKVARYAAKLNKELETLAHSVGVSEPRQIRRHHVRIVQDNGRSMPMNQIYPPQTV
ncbi:MAG: FMN-binding glutamate synthase family protein, partial [Pseudomonadota bacterium]